MIYFKTVSILWLLFHNAGGVNPIPVVVPQCYSITWDASGRSIVQPVDMSFCK